MLSATDPVAVVAVLHEVRRLGRRVLWMTRFWGLDEALAAVPAVWGHAKCHAPGCCVAVLREVRGLRVSGCAMLGFCNKGLGHD